LKTLRSPLLTVWPVITETIYLLSFSGPAQDALWEWFKRGALNIAELSGIDIPRIQELMKKYRDLPMDLADAALVRVAERDKLRSLFTLDFHDFRLYRPSHVRSLSLILV
jgi:predicted nucleic acid-binding protein